MALVLLGSILRNDATSHDQQLPRSGMPQQQQMTSFDFSFLSKTLASFQVRHQAMQCCRPGNTPSNGPINSPKIAHSNGPRIVTFQQGSRATTHPSMAATLQASNGPRIKTSQQSSQASDLAMLQKTGQEIVPCHAQPQPWSHTQ